MPMARELAIQIDKNLGLNSGSDELAQVAQLTIIRRKGRSDLIAQLQTLLDGFEPTEAIVGLTKIKWQAIYTTNYDRGILRAYELNPDPPQQSVAVEIASDVATLDRRFDVPVYFLHGSLFSSRAEQVLITEDDYSLFRQSRHMLFDSLRSNFADATFVYVGYGNQDPNWSMLQAEIRTEFGTMPLPPSLQSCAGYWSH